MCPKIEADDSTSFVVTGLLGGLEQAALDGDMPLW
jgi:hypothetical protein